MNVMAKAHEIVRNYIANGARKALKYRDLLKGALRVAHKQFKEMMAAKQEPKKVVTALDVYAAMQEVNENGYVYLDNVDLEKLGINSVQFSGFCSALARCGMYKPVDANFGKLID